MAKSAGYILRRWGATVSGRPGLFVILAFLLAAQNTYASTLIASLFLSKVGVDAIPIFYVFFAAVSIPISVLFTNVIDRFPRSSILKVMLSIFLVISSGLALLLQMGAAWYYVVYICISLFEHMLYSVYYILFADYFTVIEAKKNAGRVALGMAGGALSGGALVSFVNAISGPHVALLMTPTLVGVVVGYVIWLARRHRPLEATESAAEESLFDSARIVPRLLRSYPLVMLMSVAMFLNVVLENLSEYIAFSIFAMHYPTVDELATFLGLVQGGVNLLGFLIVVAFTNPQMTKLGVARMNLVYPVLDVVSFGVLSLSTSLPAGILANVAYDPFKHSIDVPVTTMNYNAIRYRFIGRVRVFIDGIIDPLGLATAGFLLIAFGGVFDLNDIAVFGLALSVVFLFVHWYVGKYYVQSLLDMLRDGAVDLDNIGSSLRIPHEHLQQISGMLAAGDPRSAYLGLQMAVRCSAELPPSEIGQALSVVSTQQRREVFALLFENAGAARRQTLEQFAYSGPRHVRRLALERLLSSTAWSAQEQATLLTDPDDVVRAVAAASMLSRDSSNAVAYAILTGALSADAAIGAITVLRARGGEGVVVILTSFASHAVPSVRALALSAAGVLAPSDASILALAQEASSDSDPGVRAAAFSVLAQLAPADQLGVVAEKGLGDGLPEVRNSTANALGKRGNVALPAILLQLRSEREAIQLAAIDALVFVEGVAVANVLFEAMEDRVLRPIDLILRLAKLRPTDRPGWQAMDAALANAKARTMRVAMHVLSALGHRRTLNLVRVMMKTADQRSRANAIESLASLPNRRFVVPLLPLLEEQETADQKEPFDLQASLRLLREALSSPDPWLRAAATVAFHAESGVLPEGTLQDADPMVAETARKLAHPSSATRCAYHEDPPMNRLAFLHTVPLFAGGSLEDLVAVDAALTFENYLEGEAIVTEGEIGDRLFIVFRGAVAVRIRQTDGERELARLVPGDFFGEMSLFDDEPRSATVAAVDKVEVLVLSRDHFRSLVQQRPGILMALCTTLVRRLRKAIH